MVETTIRPIARPDPEPATRGAFERIDRRIANGWQRRLHRVATREGLDDARAWARCADAPIGYPRFPGGRTRPFGHGIPTNRRE